MCTVHTTSRVVWADLNNTEGLEYKLMFSHGHHGSVCIPSQWGLFIVNQPICSYKTEGVFRLWPASCSTEPY